MKNFFYIIALAVVLSACDKNSLKPEIMFSDEELSYVDNMNKYSFSISQTLIESQENKGIIFSPFSIMSSLAMSDNYIQQDNLAKQFGFDKVEDMNKLFKKINDKLMEKKDGIDLSAANLFIENSNKGSNLSALIPLKDYYYAGTDSRDFKETEKVSDFVCEWIKQKTKEQIVFERVNISDDSRYLSCNALYFSGKWDIKFAPELTKKEKFTTAPGVETEVEMMHIKDAPYIMHCEKPNCVSVNLPMGGDKYEMAIVLMKDGAELSHTIWKSLNPSKRPVSLALPKYTFESKSEISIPGFADRYIYHGAKISVDEEGATAAAATVVGDTATAPVEFVANRPFWYVLTEKKSGLILLMGHYIPN